MNFDFLQAGKLHCFLPEKGLLEPYLVIRVTQPPSSMGASVGYGAYSVGEVLVTLEESGKMGVSSFWVSEPRR